METNQADDENRFLRDEIVYSSPFYYYFGIIEDFVLRFAWTFTVSVTHDKVLKSQVCDRFVSSACISGSRNSYHTTRQIYLTDRFVWQNSYLDILGDPHFLSGWPWGYFYSLKENELLCSDLSHSTSNSQTENPSTVKAMSQPNSLNENELLCSASSHFTSSFQISLRTNNSKKPFLKKNLSLISLAYDMKKFF